MGVDWRYSRFGLLAMMATARIAADREPVACSTMRVAAYAASPDARTEMRTPDAPVRYSQSTCTGKQVQQMRQRQPHGADLPPRRREAVEHTPRDDQMAFGIVVAQRESLVVVHQSRREAPYHHDAPRTTTQSGSTRPRRRHDVRSL